MKVIEISRKFSRGSNTLSIIIGKRVKGNNDAVSADCLTMDAAICLSPNVQLINRLSIGSDIETIYICGHGHKGKDTINGMPISEIAKHILPQITSVKTIYLLTCHAATQDYRINLINMLQTILVHEGYPHVEVLSDAVGTIIAYNHSEFDTKCYLLEKNILEKFVMSLLQSKFLRSHKYLFCKDEDIAEHTQIYKLVTREYIRASITEKGSFTEIMFFFKRLYRYWDYTALFFFSCMLMIPFISAQYTSVLALIPYHVSLPVIIVFSSAFLCSRHIVMRDKAGLSYHYKEYDIFEPSTRVRRAAIIQYLSVIPVLFILGSIISRLYGQEGLFIYWLFLLFTAFACFLSLMIDTCGFNDY